MLHRTRTLSRRGTILPLLAVTCFALFGFIALAVDLGMMMVARSECQNAADTASLTGARILDNDVPDGVTLDAYNNKRPEAIATATVGVRSNYLMKTTFAFSDAAVDKVEVGIYDYDTTAQLFKPIFPAANAPDPSVKLTNNGSIRPWTAVRVTVKGDQPTYFARIFGITSMPITAIATAAHRPRDIAMVLDYSGSMRFGAQANYPPGQGSSNGAVIGLLNPDPRFPQFGHYARYNGRATNSPNGSNQHPFQTTVAYQMSSGEICSPNNHTWTSTGGPPMVNDFYQTTNLTPTAPVDPNLLVPAFNTSVLPKGLEYNNQAVGFSVTTVGDLGDRWPRKGGYRDATGADWDPTIANGAARNAAELVYLGVGGVNANAPAQRALPTAASVPAIPTGIPGVSATATQNGGTTWNAFMDYAWERLGYDLDLVDYRTSVYTRANARTTELFQGYTLGPGYWGKTFFCWPPDPRYGPPTGTARTAGNMPNVAAPDSARPSFDTSGRAMCDWRQRFFLRGDGSKFDPQTDNIIGSGGANDSINRALLNTTAGGHVLSATTANYQVNYPAILAWLKTGPQTLPANLRAGRMLFYTQIPTDCTNPTNQDEWFWREYIDYVLGTTKNRNWNNPAYCQAGVETTAWGTFSLTDTAQHTPSVPAGAPANPRPYMNYSDTPNMPRSHFWFGPASMMMFLATRAQFSGGVEWNFNPGTVRESQSWQLKAAMQSAIDDIRKNHPNDQVGMAFFAWANYTTPRCPMGQDWNRIKASMFFPKNYGGGADNGAFLTDVVNGAVHEERPYSFASGGVTERMVGNLPNANGGTDPNNGLAQAFNLLSSADPTLAPGAGGRRGATKIVIFETDGVPNSVQNWDYVAAGTNTRYNWIDSGSSLGNGNATCMSEAYSIVQQIVAPTTAAAPGYTLPNSKARVYPFGFGDMFSSNSPFKPTALTFLQTIGYYGNTNSGTGVALPVEQVITGSYDVRISNLRTGLERVFQNGVQVALIE